MVRQKCSGIRRSYLGDAPLVRLQNKFYLGCVIWPDDGTVSSVATKGE